MQTTVSPTGAAPASGDAGEANRPSEMEQPASPADASLPSGAKLSFADARPILDARYATEDGQTLADELGLSLGTLRNWAFKLGLTSKERARANGRAHADQLIRHGVAS